jgi:peptidoglycan/xylan/chitin deacetylase (PgdA/CDA1 family)
MRQHVPKLRTLGIQLATVGLLVGVGAIVQSPGAYAVSTNLVSNPSVENPTAVGSTIPMGWTFDSWGTNTVSSAWSTTAKDGKRGLSVAMTARSSGDAKWMSTPVAVTAGSQYVLSDWYISNVQTSLELFYTLSTGKVSYVGLATVPASASWKQASVAFTAPANATSATIYHLISKAGTLQTDLYSVTQTSAPVTTPSSSSSSASPSPSASASTSASASSSASASASSSASVSASASASASSSSPSASASSSSPAGPVGPTVSITAPASGATVAGTQSLTATATDPVGIAGVQFQVDGVSLGAEETTAPYATTWDSTTVANGTHTLSAVARDTGGRSTTATTQVAVNNTPVSSTNLIGNPSAETSSGGSPSGWSSDSWGTNTTAFSYLSTGHTGTHSLKTDITSYTDGDAKWHGPAIPVTAGKSYQFGDWYQANVATEVDVEVTMADGTLQYAAIASPAAAAAWTKVVAQYTAPVNAKSVTVFHVIAAKGFLITDDYSLTEYTPTGFSRGMVSLTFDDGWRSQYTNGLPLLNQFGMNATFYLLTSTVDYPDYMTVAQMQALQSSGNEIAAHTVTHPDLTTLTAAAVDQELKDCQTSLRGWMGSGVAKNFATPYGSYNPAVVSQISTYYRSHRTVDEGYNSKDNFDIYHIKVQNILNTTTPDQVGAWVDQAVKDHTWLVLVYHEVDTGLADPTYSVTPANFSTELNLIKAKGVAVHTVDKALDEVQSQL